MRKGAWAHSRVCTPHETHPIPTKEKGLMDGSDDHAMSLTLTLKSG